MLGLEHPCHLLQTVQVGLLRAAGGKGHSDDTLCDVGEVQLMAVLHGGAQDHEPMKEREGLVSKGEKEKKMSICPPGFSQRSWSICILEI
jgi:hypothetical protein